MRGLFIFLFTLISFISFSQAQEYLKQLKKENFESRERLRKKNFTLTEDEQKLINKCATAARKHYLTDLEKEFILLHNLARTNPQFFKKYIALAYDSSFVEEIPKIPSVDRSILKPAYGLYLSAKEHAKVSGENGTTGHQNFESRIKKHNFFKHYRGVGENCSYHEESALVHFISLLNSPRHYTNIMTPNFNYIGVSLKPHKKYGTNIVTCFASK